MNLPFLYFPLSGWALGLVTLLAAGSIGSPAFAQPSAANPVVSLDNERANTDSGLPIADSGSPLAEGLKVDLAALTQEKPTPPTASSQAAATAKPKTSDLVRGLMAVESARANPPPPAATAATPSTLIQAGDMIGFSRDLGDGVQAITIINASLRWMAVYHIDTSGQIRLTSSRPLQSDFTLQFNATSPLPEEIRRLQR